MDTVKFRISDSRITSFLVSFPIYPSDWQLNIMAVVSLHWQIEDTQSSSRSSALEFENSVGSS